MAQTIIRQSIEPEEVPFSLLHQADPSPQKIREYLPKGKTLIAENKDGEIIGVCILVFENAAAEIKNISIKKEHQGTGIGKQLLAAAKGLCEASQIKTLEVRTGNSSMGQLAFYQKCGFEIEGIVPDFFIKNYAEPIFENGIQCKHQIILRYEFTDF